MSGALGHLNIQLSLDQVNFQRALKQSEYAAKQFAERTTQHLTSIEKATVSLNKSHANLIKFNIAKPLIDQTIRYADSYTELNNKIKLVTDSERERITAVQAVYDISLKTMQTTQATSSVYQTFAQNAKALSISQGEVAQLTETVSKAVAISGASTASASNALIQFSQSLLMGKLKAQEFNSLMTQTPAVVQAIAEGLGLTIGQLKELVDKGEMPATKMIEGLKNAKEQVDQLYSTTDTITYATMNISQGVNLFWLAKQMGHKGSEMLFRNYGSYLKDYDHKSSR